MEDFILLCRKIAELECISSDLRPLIRGKKDIFDEKDIFNRLRIRIGKTNPNFTELLNDLCSMESMGSELNLRADYNIQEEAFMFDQYADS